MGSKGRIRNAGGDGGGAVLDRNSMGSRVELDCVCLRLDIRLMGYNGRVRTVGDNCNIAVAARNSISNRLDLDCVSRRSAIGRLDTGGSVGTRVLSRGSDGGGVRNKGSLNQSSSVVRTGNAQRPGVDVGLGLGNDCREWNRGGVCLHNAVGRLDTGCRVGIRILSRDSEGGSVRNKGSFDKSSSVVRTGNAQRPSVDVGLGLSNYCRQRNRDGGTAQRRANDSSGAIPDGDSPGGGRTGRGHEVRDLDGPGAIVLSQRLGFDRSDRLVNGSGHEVWDLDDPGAVVFSNCLGLDGSDRLLDSSGGEVRDLDGPGEVVPNHRLGFDRGNRPVDSNRRGVVGESDGVVTQVHDLRGDDSVSFCRRIASVDQSVARRSDGGAVLVWRSRGLRHRQDAAGRCKSGGRIVVADCRAGRRADRRIGGCVVLVWRSRSFRHW
jgi:hypothetical protein